MSAFTDFQNILPDPNNAISYAGDDDSASVGRATGPGFASVKFSSEQPLMRDRTNSGRLLTRAIAFHKWKISLLRLSRCSSSNPISGLLARFPILKIPCYSDIR